MLKRGLYSYIEMLTKLEDSFQKNNLKIPIMLLFFD